MFKLNSEYQPSGDQPEAIKELVAGLKEGKKAQVLMGVTGSGKTFTIANVINTVNKPTLILSHNKTLAGQLFSELKALFPENRVEYFVSNFDFYQPEAYIPQTDTYIDKNAVMNQEIEMMRSSAINSALERDDTIIVASVAAIYGLNDPEEYSSLLFYLRVGETLNRKEIVQNLIDAQYQRNQLDIPPGSFRVRGDVLEIAPPWSKEFYVRVELDDDVVERITEVDPVTGQVVKGYQSYPIYPAAGHASSKNRILEACVTIQEELGPRLAYFRDEGKPLEEERLRDRTLHDIESLQEFGICPGIENYSRHIDKRAPGTPPYTLFDYFKNKDYLLVVDESHVSLPQVRGMYNGDRARKETLVKYGFRLPSALDNRPLKFEEFEGKINQVIFMSATPGDYELNLTNHHVVEQIIRPTGLVDPQVIVRPAEHQIDDIINEINQTIANHERVLITTLTIRMAEDLTAYLKSRGYKVAYLHNETKTLQRTQIIYELRKGKYDVLVGINLLREGLDIPEVSKILILDADKEGFLRSEKSLIQIIGRAARNVNGTVIMYANQTTDSMEKAISETNRRRKIQQEYNEKHGIIPKTIYKEVKPPVHISEDISGIDKYLAGTSRKLKPKSKDQLLVQLTKQMNEAARKLDFEEAAELRDIIMEIRSEE
ncbi:MAG: excinuclease ABC subunit UvrB [Bacilli bacterium]|nr:excinuclease ABC subunit UvrB [Bacilli bacterium]MDD3422540.1 excinuclease ABC subunit UvrB [Bacilli bacterium]MDD4065761.1 excinuclease ABC subunit UvrB [Bacilli bacterium]